MKSCFILLVILVHFSQTVYGQDHKLKLTVKSLDNEKVVGVNEDTAAKALRIASFFFNSKEFNDTLKQLSFPYSNHCANCNPVKNRTEKIPGAIIFDSLYRRTEVALDLVLKPVGKKPRYGRTPAENKCFTLGRTCDGEDFITSYHENINCDMAADIPFPYAYGVHLCHEYMHNVGFCHANNDIEDDIADAIGWIAFHYINKWYHEQRPDFLSAANGK